MLLNENYTNNFCILKCSQLIEKIQHDNYIYPNKNSGMLFSHPYKEITIFIRKTTRNSSE